MPHINELKESRFLKKEDCGPNGILVTVKDVIQENIAKDGAPEELKWVVEFAETEKPMVLNPTNAQLIAAITGKPNTEDWNGARIVLYNEPSVQFQGKITGGIRVRAPRGKAAQSAPPAAKPHKLPPEPPVVAPQEDPAEDVPF